MATARQEQIDALANWTVIDRERLCTKPMYRFLRDYHEAIRFFMFVLDLATRADKMRFVAAEALASAGGTSDHIAAFERAKQNPNIVFDELRKFSRLQSQNLILRTSNSFLVFYSEIIQAAILKRPEILKSKQTIRWDELLGFTRFDDVVRYLIDKKVNEIAYAGLSQMEEFMSERLGVAGGISVEQRALTSILVEVRNIYTHNRGTVNGIFLSRVRNHMGFEFVEGEYFHADLDHLMLLAKNCIEVAFQIDEEVAKKFGLQRKRYRVWRGSKAEQLSPVGTEDEPQ